MVLPALGVGVAVLPVAVITAGGTSASSAGSPACTHSESTHVHVRLSVGGPSRALYVRMTSTSVLGRACIRCEYVSLRIRVRGDTLQAHVRLHPALARLPYEARVY